MNKKLVKVTTAATLASTVLSPYTTVMAQGTDAKMEMQTDSNVVTQQSVEDAKKALEEATKRNEEALKAQQTALDELNAAKQEKEAAEQKVADAIRKAEEARATAEALLSKKQTESKENLSLLNTQYEEAMKAEQDARAFLAAQQTVLEQQIAIQEAANKKLEEAKANVSVTEQEVTGKQEDLEKAKAQYETASANAEAAKQKVEALKQDISASEAEKAQAQKELDQANASKTEAESKIPALQQKLDEAKTAYETALNAYNNGTPELDAAKQQVAQAQQALDQANADLVVKQQAIGTAEQALKDAQDMIVDAELGVTEADKQLAIANASSVLANANAEYQTSVQVQQNASAVYATESAKLEEISAKFFENENRLQELRQIEENAQKNYDSMSADIFHLKGRIEELSLHLTYQEQDLIRLQGEQAQAQAEYDKAQEVLKTAITSKEQAELAVKDAEVKLEQAKQEAMTAQEQIKKGAFGFYEHMGCQEAIDELNHYIADYSTGKYENAWNLGTVEDATSLENMKESIKYLEYCQELIRKEREAGHITTTGDFKVSLTQMAVSQAGANLSSVIGTHSHTTGDENLCFSDIMTPESAYEGWYWDEKKNKEEFNGGQTGHYENIVLYSDGDSVHGFAIHGSTYTEDGSNINLPTFAQNFSSVSWHDPKFTYTLEEYKTHFMNYYNDLHAKLNGEQAAQKALEEAKKGLENALAEVDSATKVSDSAKNKLDTAKNYTAKTETAIALKKDTISTLNKELEEKNNLLAEAQKNLEQAKANTVAAFEESQRLMNEKNEQQKKTDAAKAEMELRTNEMNDKKVILEDARKAYKELTGKDQIPTVEEADQMLKDAQSAKEQAVQALQSAKENETAKREALAKANEEATKAVEEVAKKEGLVKDAEKNHAQLLAEIHANLVKKEEDMNLSKKALEDAKAVLDSRKQEVKDAEQKFNAKDKALYALYEKMEEAQADYDFKLAANNISKNVYEEAQKNYEEAVKAITPLRDAKAEYEKAVADRKAQESKVEEADKEVLAKQALTETAKSSADDAKKDHEVLSNATVDGLVETPMTEEEYLFLNAYVDGYKQSLDAKAQADKEALESMDKVTASEQKYEDAKDHATKTMADLVIAQDNYNQAVENQKPEIPLTPIEPSTPVDPEVPLTPLEPSKPVENPEDNNGAGSTQKPENQKPETQKPENQKPETQKPENQKPEGQKPNNGTSSQTTNPKTGDPTALGMASLGLFGSATLAAFTMKFRRKRKDEE